MTGTQHTRSTDVVVIGGGQAGLAMSRCLTDASVDHVVLERGQTAHSWRTERWDSLRLLTPNWMTRLPGFEYDGDDPDGYMTNTEVIGFLDAYRHSFDAPVHEGTTVTEVTPHGDGYRVSTDAGIWQCLAVVIATGACSNPYRPAVADGFPAQMHHLAPNEYRNPDHVPEGAVLVVGASASGLQIADELNRAGREVTLAVGEHVRLPRTYRGMDIHWWMDAIGALDERYDEVEDITKSRRLPSLQLVGTDERRTLNLNSVSNEGVTLVGRIAGIDGSRAQCSGSLANVCKLADLKQGRLLDRIDEYARDHGLEPELSEPTRPEPTLVDPSHLSVDLSAISTTVWATGYRPTYPWLDASLLDAKGQPVHDGGVMSAPGLYLLGQPFLRRRKSAFLDGVGPDARELSALLLAHLDSVTAPR